MFLVKLTRHGGLVEEREPTADPPPKFLGPPAAQTSSFFKVPDEIILCIVSQIAPEPRHSEHFIRFRLQYGLTISNSHQERMGSLRPLSMTCKTMRLRLAPWIWRHLELPRRSWFHSESMKGLILKKLFGALQGNAYLATAVMSLTVCLTLDEAYVPLFVKCLESLPNLHTLEIAVSVRLVKQRNLVRKVQLPQIKTLILPATAHFLLECCTEVEDVCVVPWFTECLNMFLKSLALNRDSRVQRLVIPLTMWENPSWFAAACPKLTELTVVFPHPNHAVNERARHVSDPLGAIRGTMFEIVEACKQLPNFNTFQIVHFLSAGPKPTEKSSGLRGERLLKFSKSLKRQIRTNREWVGAMKEAAMAWLEQDEYREVGREGRRKMTMRVIGLKPSYHPDFAILGSVKVEEYEVL